MTDKITVTGIHLMCRLGVPFEERQTPQEISVTIEMHLDLRPAGVSDSINDTVDYAEVRGVLAEVAGLREYLLVESLAEAMADAVLTRFPVPEILLSVSKPQALRAFGVDNTTIEILRRSVQYQNAKP